MGCCREIRGGIGSFQGHSRLWVFRHDRRRLQCRRRDYIPFLGGGGSPFQGFEKEANIHQVGARHCILPRVFGHTVIIEHETNSGTKFVGRASDVNDNDVWFIKTGIKRNWTPLAQR